MGPILLLLIRNCTRKISHMPVIFQAQMMQSLTRTLPHMEDEPHKERAGEHHLHVLQPLSEMIRQPALHSHPPDDQPPQRETPRTAHRQGSAGSRSTTVSTTGRSLTTDLPIREISQVGVRSLHLRTGRDVPGRSAPYGTQSPRGVLDHTDVTVRIFFPRGCCFLRW